jgi:CheY-like chemotaxis protein
MTKIFFVGKFNLIMQNIYQAMNKDYDLQLCPADADILDGMFQMVRPQLVLISAMDFDDKQKDIYQLLAEKYNWVPVVSVGRKEELRMFYNDKQTEQFHYIPRPVQISTIQRTINEILGIWVEEYQGEEEVATVKAGQKTVMLIDDSPVQLRQVRDILKEKYKVLLASSGPKAMEIMEEETPDLIFLDYNMPDMDGRATLKKIRSNPKTGHLPVVFLTAINSKDKILAVADLNPSDYLLKPVKAKRIRETAERITG